MIFIRVIDMKTTDEIIKKCDRLMSTAEVKYTRTHLELAIEEARADEAKQIFEEFDNILFRKVSKEIEDLKNKTPRISIRWEITEGQYEALKKSRKVD